MGIYDREYYRGEENGGGWFSSAAPACRTIILINAVVFVLIKLFDEADQLDIESWLGARYYDIFYRFRVWELLTATFLHADLPHIVFNMLFLWWFGHELETMYGSRDFTIMYLSAAVISTACWATVARIRGDDGLMLGASGAVLATMVIYALYYPRQRILLFFFIPVEIWVLLVLYLGFDAISFFNATRSHTAVVSHLSGAAYGYLFKTFDLRWSKLPWGKVRRPRLRVISPEPREQRPSVPRPSASPSWTANSGASAKPAPTAVLPEEQLDAKLDEVLAKIAREGRSGLTEDENRVLQEASRRARNRRSDR
jgi:membrane associated rhomboid family serine protease